MRLLKLLKLKNQVFFEFIEENKIVLLILHFFLLIGFVIWFVFDSLKEFGQNFVSEMLGVLITILIINQIIIIREEKRKIPHKFAVYDDIRLFISSFMVFWQQAFQESVPEDDPDNIYMFFSDYGMGKVWNYLYLPAIPKMAISLSWFEHLIEFASEIKDKGNNILTRHAQYLTPQVYRTIHQITEAQYLDIIKNMQKMKRYYETGNMPVINVLESYAVMKPSDKDYSSIINLYEWCEKMYDELSAIDKSIIKVSRFIPRKNKPLPPPSMIPEEVLAKETEEWSKYLYG
ncbi:MAG: hypothetical protein V1779_14790 [bacterium]